MFKYLLASRLVDTNLTASKKKVESRIKGADEYDFFTYKGKTPVEFDNRGRSLMLKTGDRFGVRPSSNGKEIRIVKEGQLTKVVTITYEEAKKLARRI